MKNPHAHRAQYAAIALSAGLLLLPWVFRLDGKPHANWEQFLGRFHPLAVHLPIGLLILLPVLELAGVSRSALREAAGLVLGLALAACWVALTLGYLLAYGSGDAGPGVVHHMWGAIVLNIGVLACMFARPAWLSGTELRIYPALLVTVLLTLVWTAHQGGSLTYGSNYLTDYMPSSLKQLLPNGAGPETAAANSFYTQYVNPIFDRNCVSCHGESKVQGGLRLDTYGQLMRGGRDGAVVVAGNPEQSLLLQRITLPQSDKHFMPAEGKPPLKPEEIAWIKAWIQQGASPSATSISGVTAAKSQDQPIKPVGDYSSLMPEIQEMAAGQGAKLVPVSSKPSDGLILSTVDVAPSFGDAQLAQFEKFAPYIVEAELGRTAVTDAGFDTLAKFTHLRALHLEGTAVTGTGLGKLAPLADLAYLNLSGTKVTSQSIAPLASMKNLHRVYLFNTPAQPAATADATPQPATKGAQ